MGPSTPFAASAAKTVGLRGLENMFPQSELLASEPSSCCWDRACSGGSMYWELFGWFAVDQGDEWDGVGCGLRSEWFEGGPAGDHERAWAGSMKPLVVDEEEGASMVLCGLKTGDGGWTSAYRPATMDL